MAKAGTDRFFDSNYRLSNSHVNNVYQDKKGFIWVCTENGLNVFNGTNFKSYFHRSGDTTSLMNNSVLTVLEDKQGSFWVGTTGGIQLFDKDTECFSSVSLSYTNITDFTYINCIIEDSKGNIWFTTSRSGIICIKAKTKQPVYYMQTNSNICSNKINVIFEDRFGNIWIGSQDNGISVLNADNHSIINYSHDPNNPNSISSNRIFSIIETLDGRILVGTIDGTIDAFDYSTRSFNRNYIPSTEKVFTMKIDSKNNLWIGTDGKGLKCYNFKDQTSYTYESELTNLDLRQAKVHSIFEDVQGNLWVALYQKGVLMIPRKEKLFYNVGFNPFYPNKNIGNECVLSVIEDQNKDIWLGTDGDGIYRLDANKEVKQHYLGSKLPDKVVLSLFEDSRKRIWVGTYLYGLFLYNPGNDSFEKRELIHNGIDVKHINSITEDKNGNLWIGTNENGVCVYNPETKSTSFFVYDLMKVKDQLLSNSVHTVAFGYNDMVWIGTSGAGLSCYNLKTKKFTDYTQENGKLSNNNIFAVSIDKTGGIWVGTNWGLNYIDPKTDESIQYSEKDGLPNAAVSGIEVDKDNNLWISTFIGLSHYNTKDKTFTNYYTSDGLINNEFRRGAYFQSHTGEIFFGGINGLTSFVPFDKQSEHALSNLAFTDLFIYNERVGIDSGKDAILSKSIDASSEIRLKYNMKSFSISFAALEYNYPDKVIYQVKLDGFENNWRTLPHGSNLATYTNLEPGTYVFNVKASLPNSTSIERSITIYIAPPLWLTWWAKIIYFLIFLGIAYFVYMNIKSRMQKRKEDMQKQNESEIMQSKLQFFTDISHEIRTPLTLILTPVEQLIKDTPEGSLRDTYKLIDQNGQRILRLVNQVMEMRKLDRGQVKLQTEETDVKEFLQEITSSFKYIAQEKEINFTLNIKDNLPTVWIDQEKMDKVLFNVLSNAFKYTPKNGTITIDVDSTNTDLQIKVIDSGCGIPKEMRQLVFNRFYQVPDKNNSNVMGTGIGLHLSRSLMEIHHGKIFVEDTDHIGSVFTILLPLGRAYLKSSEIREERSAQSLATLVQPSLSSFIDDEKSSETTFSGKSRYKAKLLIVEDDQAIKNYISGVLSNDYQIIEAENGRIGLETAIKEQPDCIITDVMMPEMDGIEMCDKIKKNEKTSHIPVIILTAKTAIEQRVEGLQVGADSYIPKPFSIEHLRVRISKLIELRRVMKDKYEGRFEIKQEDLNIKSADEKFLEKLESIVKNKMAEPELSVETISQDIGISRSQLQRKLKQLTNQNPSDYIKTTRLRHAAWLLSTKNLTISEVTYATGFSSLSHFSNSFKEFYGMSPSRYMEINSGKREEM
ncbi:two-component regulator propeller domain-containing protein [Dysgonomonas sp. 520]|uniref:hybrid sensor histidine kinase/response regulator transcription factor n=1 Tax=Dysgonomonas sp. 520 TaxID=2302931 RepID=UPI0013D7AC28|nr:two-component regulator propeller domain-containing protein [Dysgonomonas sp. 520]